MAFQREATSPYASFDLYLEAYRISPATPRLYQALHAPRQRKHELLDAKSR